MPSKKYPGLDSTGGERKSERGKGVGKNEKIDSGINTSNVN